MGRIHPQSKIKKRFTPKLVTPLCHVAENVRSAAKKSYF